MIIFRHILDFSSARAWGSGGGIIAWSQWHLDTLPPPYDPFGKTWCREHVCHGNKTPLIAWHVSVHGETMGLGDTSKRRRIQGSIAADRCHHSTHVHMGASFEPRGSPLSPRGQQICQNCGVNLTRSIRGRESRPGPASRYTKQGRPQAEDLPGAAESADLSHSELFSQPCCGSSSLYFKQYRYCMSPQQPSRTPPSPVLFPAKTLLHPRSFHF